MCVRDLGVKYQQRHMTVGTVYGLRPKDSETFYFKSPKLDLFCFPSLFRSNYKLTATPANTLTAEQTFLFFFLSWWKEKVCVWLCHMPVSLDTFYFLKKEFKLLLDV